MNDYANLARMDHTRKCSPLREPLLNEIFPSIKSRAISGYRGISLCKREIAGEVEFVTIMWFDSLDAVRLFSGENYELAVVPSKARAVLARFDAASAHYETFAGPPFLF